MTLRYALLGRLLVAGRDSTATALRPLARSVLAYLLMSANLPVSTAALTEALWAGVAPATARAQLHAHVSAIRAALRGAGATDAITTSVAGYRIRVAEGELDLDEFTRKLAEGRQLARIGQSAAAIASIRSALAVWRGPALADVVGTWVDGARIRLEGIRLTAEEERADLALAIGEHGQVAADLMALAAAHPTRERLHGLLMLALFRCHRRVDALGVARRLRASLVDEQGLDPGRYVTDLERRILHDDPVLYHDGTVAANDIAVATRPVPAELPAGVADFTGRDGQLAAMSAALAGTDSGPAVLALVGMPGMGKTALAVRWARTVVDRFPDGQLFIEMRGHGSGEPTSPGAALRRMLRSLGVAPERVPAADDEAAALFRSVTADRRLLLVFDDACDAGQVRGLVPGAAGCAVVVTSRYELGGLVAREGARQLEVTGLSPGEARQLLAAQLGTSVVGADDRAIGQLIELCAGMPLALRIAAAAMRTRGDDPADMVARMRADPSLGVLDLPGDEVHSLRWTLDLSYRTLPEPARRLFRLAARVPGNDLSIGLMAALGDLPPAVAEDVAGRLRLAHFLEQPVDGRYRMHDLLRRFDRDLSRREGEPTGLEAARRRMYAYLLAHVDAAAGLLYPQLVRLPAGYAGVAGPGEATSVQPRLPRTPAEALAWLDAERATLTAAVVDGADHGLCRVVCAIADGLRGHFAQRVMTREWLPIAGAALRAARRDNDHMARSAAQLSLAHLRHRQNRYPQAAAHAELARSFARRAGWLDGEIAAEGTLGNATQLAGDLRRAADSCRAVIAASVRARRPAAAAAALGNLGIVHSELGELADALDCHQRSLAEFERLGITGGIALAHAHLAESYQRLRDLDRAVGHFEHALRLHRTLGDQGAEGDALRGLADTLIEMGKATDAVLAADRAVDIARAGRQWRYLAEALLSAGQARLVLGSPVAALACFDEAREAAVRTADPTSRARVLTARAVALAALGRPDEAAGDAADALELARGCGLSLQHADQLRRLAAGHRD